MKVGGELTIQQKNPGQRYRSEDPQVRWGEIINQFAIGGMGSWTPDASVYREGALILYL